MEIDIFCLPVELIDWILSLCGSGRSVVILVCKRFRELGRGVKGRELSGIVASENSFELLKWMHKEKFPFGRSIWTDVARSGNLEMLKWIIKKYQMSGFYCEVAEVVIERGYLNMIEWLVSGKLFLAFPGRFAAKYERLDVLIWMHQREICSSSDYLVAVAAAIRGNFDILKWCWNNGYELTSHVCVCAVRGGHLDILKWAVGKGCELPERICIVAGESGQLEILKWLKEKGCA